jgi:hypothetical protein
VEVIDDALVLTVLRFADDCDRPPLPAIPACSTIVGACATRDAIASFGQVAAAACYGPLEY